MDFLSGPGDRDFSIIPLKQMLGLIIIPSLLDIDMMQSKTDWISLPFFSSFYLIICLLFYPL